MSLVFRSMRPGAPFGEKLRALDIEPDSVERVIMTHGCRMATTAELPGAEHRLQVGHEKAVAFDAEVPGSIAVTAFCTAPLGEV